MDSFETLAWFAIMGAAIIGFILHAIYRFNRAAGFSGIFGMHHDEIYYHDENGIEEDED